MILLRKLVTAVDKNLIGNSKFWSLIERVYDFVLCFEIKSGKIIRKYGFDKICIELDKHDNYYPLMKQYQSDYVHPGSLEEFSEKTSIDYLLVHDFVRFVGLEKIENNEQRWYEYIIVAEDNIGAMFICDFHTSHCRMLELEQASSKDYLTKLMNRRVFDEYVEDLIENKSPFSLFFIDVDGFKSINDQYGHTKGDTVLKEIADILTNTLPDHCVIARYGGDEFVVCVLSVKEISQVKNYLDSLMEAMIPALNCGLKISLSIGVSFYPKNGQSRKQLIHGADTALYHAKKNGKSQYKEAQ